MNAHRTFEEVGVLLLDVSVNITFTDFLQARIKRKNCEKIS